VVTIASYSSQEPVAVVGDIHGRLDLLDRLLVALGTRRVFVIGDVVDRGPDSRGVIDRLLQRKAVGVRGNHEEWLLAWLRGEGLDDWAIRPKMGGLATLRSYGATGVSWSDLESQVWRIPDGHRAFLESLTLVADLEVMGQRYWLVHAGIPSHVPLEGIPIDRVVPHLAQHHPRELLWASNDPETMLPVDRPVVMGHQPRDKPMDNGDVIAIDTGAATLERGRLTAVLLPERRFVTVGP
jgi:serine/threonine protein phosphatase 1